MREFADGIIAAQRKEIGEKKRHIGAIVPARQLPTLDTERTLRARQLIHFGDL